MCQLKNEFKWLIKENAKRRNSLVIWRKEMKSKQENSGQKMQQTQRKQRNSENNVWFAKMVFGIVKRFGIEKEREREVETDGCFDGGVKFCFCFEFER